VKLATRPAEFGIPQSAKSDGAVYPIECTARPSAISASEQSAKMPM
jgi:hypothetical protein